MHQQQRFRATMEPLIKMDLGGMIEREEQIIIDLGCGPRKRTGTIGVDRIDMNGVDIVADLEDSLSFLPNGCVDRIYCRSVLEHVSRFEALLEEMVRVLKPDGVAHVFVPHFSNPYFYSDYTHQRFFGLYTFYYFVEPDKQLRRKVPNYHTSLKIRIVSQKLVFRSNCRLLQPFKKLWGKLINLHPRLQEWYEENWCYLVPCHGIEVVFSRNA